MCLHSHKCHPSFVLQNERRCECKQGYVGDGIQCLEEAVPPTDRCLEDNGQCHREAICTDLHFHGECAPPCSAGDDGPWRSHTPSSFTFWLGHPSGELDGGIAKGPGTHVCSFVWFSHSPFPLHVIRGGRAVLVCSCVMHKMASCGFTLPVSTDYLVEDEKLRGSHAASHLLLT